MKPYNWHPELATDPAEFSDKEWNRINRNNMREDAIQAIHTLISNLDELDHDGKARGTQRYLENLRDYLSRDMED